nr:hypothetical protein [uncultured bacterium]
MKRLHLFEWEDQRWLPCVFRDFITDHLHYSIERGQLFVPIVPLLHRALTASGETQIIDLCSGGSGPYPGLVRRLEEDFGMRVPVTLTDLFPNQNAIARAAAEGGGLVTYRAEPTSAFDVPSELKGLRTIFTALHHFRPADVKLLLADAVAKRRPIAAFEFLERRVSTLMKIGTFAFLSGILSTHRVGNLTAARALSTYLLPLGPFFYSWDGMVSCLRTYTPDDLRALTADLSEDYHWEIGQVDARQKFGQYKITYVIGLPQKSQTQAA